MPERFPTGPGPGTPPGEPDDGTTLVDPEVFDMPEGFEPPNTAKMRELDASLDDRGQLVEVVACDSETHPGMLVPLDGLHRIYLLKRRRRKVRVRKVPRPSTEVERLVLGYSINANRRIVPLEEKRETLARVMEADSTLTQKAAAKLLGMSETEASNLLSVDGIPGDWLARLRAAMVCNSTICLIGPIPSPELMKRAVDYACTPGPDGAKPSRDDFYAWLRRQKKTKSAGRPAASKTIVLVVDGRRFTVEVKDDDTTETLSKSIASAPSQLTPYLKMPVQALLAVYGDERKGRSRG